MIAARKLGGAATQTRSKPMPSKQSENYPNYRERTVLQVLRGNLWQFQSKFAAVAGPEAIEAMVAKRWIIRLPSDPNKIAITAGGKSVLTVPRSEA